MARRPTGLQHAEEVFIKMPREYADHPLCKQLMTLKDEEMLQDVHVTFGPLGQTERMSGFLLSLLSPVWRVRLCGQFSHGRERRLELEEDEVDVLKTVLELGCGGGEGRVMNRGLKELLEVERYQVDEVRNAVEDVAICHLKVETCELLLITSEGSGLRRLEEACRRMALERFEELTRTEGFFGMEEETLRSLLEDDGLECFSEEAVFEGLVRWMRGGARSEVRGERLLETIRFPLMREDYLTTRAGSALRDSELLERLVSEGSVLKGLPAAERSKHVKFLGGKALRERVWSWVKCHGVLRLPETSSMVYCLAYAGDRVCGGRHDGTITVWNKTSLEVERTLTGHTDTVGALAECDGWLVSGSWDKDIRVWDVSSGQCLRRLEGHDDFLLALAYSEKTLLSGSHDKTIRVWIAEGAPSTWRYERTLAMHIDPCRCLAWWGSKAVSGCESGAIRVWDLSMGMCVQTLLRHKGPLTALVVRQDRLLSASQDGSLREWCLKSGACVKVVEVYPAFPGNYVSCLVVSRRKLAGGILASDLACYDEMVVWDLDTLAEERRLEQPAGLSMVLTLLAMDGEVWGGAGNQLVVWGREG